MKLFVLAIGFMVCINANASSLEDLWNRQNQLTIQPVEISGKFVSGDDFHAAGVCASLGYSRLVSFESQPCGQAEQIARFSNYGSVLSVGGSKRCGWSGEYSSKLTVVTCAR